MLLGDGPDLLPLKQLLIDRAEGNPFFLEEGVRTLVEQKVLIGARGARRLAKPIAHVQVPATVQAILAARIDDLPLEHKRLLQCAAVIGRNLSLPLLRAVGGLAEGDLQQGLARLQAGEFLYETNLFPDIEYTFKHALTPGGGLRQPAPGAAAIAPRPHPRGDGGALRRSPERAGGDASPITPSRARCGTRR